MSKLLCVCGLFMGYAPLACGQSMTVDKSEIRFVGAGCKSLSAEQVSFQGKRLLIDLKGMTPLTPDQPRASCLIKIPYRSGKGRVGLSLDGHYDLSPEDQLALSWRFDPGGALGPARILSLSETTKGRVSWQDHLNLDAAEAQADGALLRISLYMDWKEAQGGEKGAAPIREAQQPLLLRELAMSPVEAFVKTVDP